MNEIQNFQYITVFTNIIKLLISVVITIAVRNNLKAIDSKRLGLNHNYALFNFFPYLDIFILPIFLHRIEKRFGNGSDEKSSFGFKYSLLNSALIVLTLMLTELPLLIALFMSPNMGDGTVDVNYLSLEMVLKYLQSYWFGLISLGIAVARSYVCYLIYRNQLSFIDGLEKAEKKVGEEILMQDDAKAIDEHQYYVISSRVAVILYSVSFIAIASLIFFSKK
jgi:hypothetical protein